VNEHGLALKVFWSRCGGKTMSITVFSPQTHTHDLLKVFPVSDIPEDQQGRFFPQAIQLGSIQFLEFEVQNPTEPYPEPPNPNEIGRFLPEAIALNRENQPLATGEAFLYPWLEKGDFFPQKIEPAKLGTLPQHASILKTLEGQAYAIEPENLMCQDRTHRPHFHFHYRKAE
jgi:hypothetical protein